ncbi:MAG: hypothetical protein KC422_00385 [Trueperaceae bacterium]|nr:hypothetical protein [Trueperaceae bacterium]
MRYLRFGFLLVSSLLLSSCLSRRDALAPIVTIYDPPNGATQGLESPIVSGYAMDDNGILSLKVDDTDLLSNAIYQSQKGKKLVQFSFRVNPQSNEFVANISAEDSSGNITVLPYRLKVDTQAPSLEATAVRISSSRLRISGVARDNDAVKSITVEGISVPFLASAEQSFNVDVTASDSATIVVEDRAGNKTSQAVNP